MAAAATAGWQWVSFWELSDPQHYCKGGRYEMAFVTEFQYSHCCPVPKYDPVDMFSYTSMPCASSGDHVHVLLYDHHSCNCCLACLSTRKTWWHRCGALFLCVRSFVGSGSGSCSGCWSGSAACVVLCPVCVSAHAKCIMPALVLAQHPRWDEHGAV